ncbi:hypothetical protein J4226_03130 [Candidatus Pacearchaeota archaeon]|nr:hypothetical protein [Candidatus Pacearchaeota archaeon]
MKNLMEKKGQVTIFILIGILIVSAILIFFLWARPTFLSEGSGVKGFEGCVADAMENGISELEGKAGFIDADFTYTYQGEELTYLCYTNNFYETCTVQVPFLKNVFDENLEVLIREEVDACYEASLNSLKDQGYEVVSGAVNYNVEIEPGVVRLEIDAPTSVGTSRFARFNVKVNSPAYETVMIATSILQFETKYGDSDVSAMMLYYPDYYIEKTKRGEGTTVYVLENKVFGDKFKFASRSLVFPAGYDL